MKILYLVPHVPNPTKIRSYMHVNGLLADGHRLTVATLERSPEDARHLDKLRAKGIQVLSAPLPKSGMLVNGLTAFAAGQPLQARLLWSRPLMQLINEHLQTDPPDVIHIEHLRMAGYGMRLVSRWPVVFDAVDAISQLYQHAARESVNPLLRLISMIESPRLRVYEHNLTEYFPITTVISTTDQRIFQQNAKYADRVHVIPMGLPLVESPAVPVERSDNVLVITGTWDYHPNIAAAHYFVRDILPLIQAQRPDIRLQIVGAHPAPDIQALADSTIEVTGFVPSIHDYLRRSTIAIAPITYGSGMQIKVLEAFMTATPLVASSTALRGLDVHHGEHVLVADSPQAFAEAVLTLLNNPALRNQIGDAGCQYVTAHHDLSDVIQQLITFYQAAVAAYGS